MITQIYIQVRIQHDSFYRCTVDNTVILRLPAGVLDSSGVRFTYTDEPQKHRAGILTSGYTVHSGMIIPPGRNDYTITGLCPGECTKHVGHLFNSFNA